VTPLRRAEAADLAPLADLEARSFAHGAWSTGQLRGELLRNGGVVLVCDDFDALSGYACGWALAGEAEVLRVAVDPLARRRGLGRALLMALEAALAPAAERIFLEVRADNAPAIALYRGQGYAVEGVRRAYYSDGSDALVMARALGLTNPDRSGRSC